MYRQQWNGRKKDPVRGTNRRVFIVLLISRVLILIGILGILLPISRQQASERTDEEMRALYHTVTPQSGETAAPTQAPTAAPETTLPPAPAAAAVTESALPEDTAPPLPTPVPRLTAMDYPDNPRRSVSERFRALQSRNRDIIGWLTIGSMVDEAVVQRDNEFYMDHNAGRDPDVSGALFLDANISLNTRPYAMILYGHNMKTGARFGSLRNFENQDFYHRYPFITFDTEYEDGNYVIFSVGTISTEEGDPHYLDFFGLASLREDERLRAIRALQNVSLFTDTVDIRLDDQILLLVTCVQKDEERRIVAARRFREGETRQELKKLAESSRKLN